MNRTDTIVAVSSAAGSGARAIVRLSGPGAVALAAGVFAPTGAAMEEVGAFRCADGVVSARGAGGAEISLPARAYVFRAPRSFTRQDVIELHLPGSPLAAGAVVEHLVAAGARRAEPGEFTARAFFSGRIDLSAAQAVADVIDAASDAQLRSAVGAMRGRLARLCAAAASELADALATVEASIDLAEEQIELDSPRELSRRVSETAQRLDRLAADSCDMPEQAHLPRVVLCGAPNAGKSSLLNALAGFDRAIVSPVAGTTRDVLSATIVLAGSEVLLQDAAGIDEQEIGTGIVRSSESVDDASSSAPKGRQEISRGRKPPESGEDEPAPEGRKQTPGTVAPTGLSSEKSSLPGAYAPGYTLKAAPSGHKKEGGVKHIACAAAQAAIEAADVLLFVTDSLNGDDLHGMTAAWRSLNPRAPMLALLSKCDLLEEPAREAARASLAVAMASPVLTTSAVTGIGLDDLRAKLTELLHLHVSRGGEALGLHRWQRERILAARHAATRAGDLLAASLQLSDQAELVAFELRDALAHLGQISGQIVNEDILGRIFARFCVGK